MDSCLSVRKDGVVLTLKVKAGSKRSAIALLSGVLRVEVQAPATAGKANAAVVELLATHFGCTKAQIRLLRGEHDSRKVVLLGGADAHRVQVVLDQLNRA